VRLFVPRETKIHEYRVGLIPSAVRQLVQSGHEVSVQAGAGQGAGMADEQYQAAGANLVDSAAQGYERATLVVKVKEPQPEEYEFLRPEHLLFCYFHFAASRDLTEAVMRSGSTAIAYETFVDHRGRMPLLIPMSEVAGRMSIQQGAKYLENPTGGRGVLLGGVPGVEPAHVTVIGAGVVGTEAAKMAAGLGARVHLLDTDVHRLRQLSEVLPKNVIVLRSDRDRIVEELKVADLVVGAVLVRGARAPRLVLREDLSMLKSGAVIVDVAVDQGGCFESTRPTTHSDPIFIEEGIVHYCVANIPGAVSRTSTIALNNVTLPYAQLLADHGWQGACDHCPELRSALNIQQGTIVHPGVAAAFDFS
jgi:alanine dehydrogenase